MIFLCFVADAYEISPYFQEVPTEYLSFLIRVNLETNRQGPVSSSREFSALLSDDDKKFIHRFVAMGFSRRLLVNELACLIHQVHLASL